MCNSYIILILPLYLCLDELIIFKTGVLKLSTIIDLQLIFVFILITCFMKTWSQKFGSYIFIIVMYFWLASPWIIMMCSFYFFWIVSFWSLVFCLFVDIGTGKLFFFLLWVHVFLNQVFFNLKFKVVYVFKSEMSLLHTA